MHGQVHVQLEYVVKNAIEFWSIKYAFCLSQNLVEITGNVFVDSEPEVLPPEVSFQPGTKD